MANLMNCAANEYLASVKITQPHTNSILELNTCYSYEIIASQFTAKTLVSFTEQEEVTRKMLRIKVNSPELNTKKNHKLGTGERGFKLADFATD